MADEPRPVRVTVTDPRRAGAPADVLEAGRERTPLGPRGRRRLLVAGALLVAVAAAVGTAEVVERRAEAAEQRRLGSVADLDARLAGSSVAPGPEDVIVDT